MVFIIFSPTIERLSFEKAIGNDTNATTTIWVNKTVEWLVTVHVFALDNGNPRRGDFIPVNVTYSVSCEETAAVVVQDSGDVQFLVPGMQVSRHRKSLRKLFRSVLICLFN